jgi:hypothetical protein
MISFVTSSACGPVDCGTVSVTGTCVQAVTCNVSPRAINFGAVCAGQSAERTFMVGNSGNAPLTITAINSNNSAFSVLTPLPVTVPPGGSAMVSVRAAPTSPGAMTGTLSFVATGAGQSVDCGMVMLTATTPSCIQPPPGAALWLSGDNTTNDLSGANNNGSLQGGATFDASGKVQQAFSFNGTTAFVQVASNASLNFGTGDLSADAWVLTSMASGIQPLLDKRNASPVQGYALFLSNGRLGFQLASGGNFFNYIAPSTSPNVADGQWHHVVVMVRRTGGSPELKLYVDGTVVLTNTTPLTGTVNNNIPLLLGSGYPISVPKPFFAGKIDEVDIFNRPLTEQEVKDIFNADCAGKCKPSGLPDFVVPGLPVVAPVPIGEGNFIVTFRILNKGDGLAGPANHQVRLVTVGGNPNGILLTTVMTPALAAQAFLDRIVPFTVPPSPAPFTYVIRIVLDVGNQVNESDETNNMAVSLPFMF